MERGRGGKQRSVTFHRVSLRTDTPSGQQAAVSRALSLSLQRSLSKGSDLMLSEGTQDTYWIKQSF